MELLLALALVAALAALLLPAIRRVSERGAAVKCQAQLRGLAQAAFSYAADHNGLLPDRSAWKSPTAASHSLLPYVGVPIRSSGDPAADSASVLTCPAVKAGPFSTMEERRVTYSINQYATASDITNTAIWTTQVFNRGVPLRLLNIKIPARQSFFMDGTAIPNGMPVRYSAFQDPSRIGPRDDLENPGWATPFLHGDAIHVVFLDGHLERLSRHDAERELAGAANPSAGQYSPRVLPFWGASK